MNPVLELCRRARGSISMSAEATVNDPAYWRQRAEEARAVAGQLSDPVAQKAMLEIASSYEALADLATARAIKTAAPPG
jgi:hypothetical protein